MLLFALFHFGAAFNVTAVSTESHLLRVTSDGHWVTDQGQSTQGFNAEVGTTGQLAVNGRPVHFDMGGYYVATEPDSPYDNWAVVDGRLQVNSRKRFFACPEYNYQVGSAPIDGSDYIATCENPIFVELQVDE